MLDITGLTKVYRTGDVAVHALRGIDLAVAPGEFIAIMGPSGSGKSTLMNLIGCLDRPTDGSYRLVGEEVSRLGDNELAEVRNRRIGFVFQNFNLLPKLTALQNVELPLMYRGLSTTQRRQMATEALTRVGLAHRLHHRPSELSGGQIQRVAVARALAGQPAILLADEPTGNLDTRAGEEVMILFQELNRSGVTIVVVTHDDRIAAHTHRVVRLRDGRIVSDDAVADPLDAVSELAKLPPPEDEGMEAAEHARGAAVPSGVAASGRAGAAAAKEAGA
ncbi:MAG: ABC transporter ATP-binding protein [Bacillota bacterium]